MATINELDAAIKEIKESGLGGNQVHEETMRTALEALQDARRRADGCTFVQYDDNDGRTYTCSKCDCMWSFEAGNPFDNNNNFCPECGLPITAVTFIEYDDDGETIEVTRTKEEYESAAPAGKGE